MRCWRHGRSEAYIFRLANLDSVLCEQHLPPHCSSAGNIPSLLLYPGKIISVHFLVAALCCNATHVLPVPPRPSLLWADRTKKTHLLSWNCRIVRTYDLGECLFTTNTNPLILFPLVCLWRLQSPLRCVATRHDLLTLTVALRSVGWQIQNTSVSQSFALTIFHPLYRELYTRGTGCAVVGLFEFECFCSFWLDGRCRLDACGLWVVHPFLSSYRHPCVSQLRNRMSGLEGNGIMYGCCLLARFISTRGAKWRNEVWYHSVDVLVFWNLHCWCTCLHTRPDGEEWNTSNGINREHGSLGQVFHSRGALSVP